MENHPGAAEIFIGTEGVSGLMRALDWSATSLGPVAQWPTSLRSIVRMMLTSRYQMWMAWGPELTFFCNDAYSPTLGVKFPWALGQPAQSVWAEIWPEIGPMIDHVMRTGEATYSEGMLLFLERSGFREETYHTFSYSPLFDDAGAIVGMFCVVVEETDRVLNERRLGTVREFASAAAVTTGEAALFGAIGEQLGHNLADLPFTLTYLHGADGDRLAARSGIGPIDVAWPVASLGPESGPIEIDDLARWIDEPPAGHWDKPAERGLIVPITQGAGGGLAGYLVVGLNPYRPLDAAYRDFLVLLANQLGAALAAARAYEEERQRAEALAEIDRAKTAFFSNVSHEFRTPLTLMLGPLEEVMATPVGRDPTTARHQVELAHRNGIRLLRLVNSLLDFSRIEAGRVEARREPTDLAAFSTDIASSFRSAMEKAGLDFRVESRPLPHPVALDRDMWEKVLLNLLSNAFKFTLEGGVTVTIAPAADRAQAEVRVADTGIGVAEEEMPRLFERFHRIEGAAGRTYEGSGIGLALVQELVRLHGGTIEATSVPGKGTTFIVRLPYAPDAAIGTVDPRPSNAAAFVEEAMRWLPEPRDLIDDSGAAPPGLPTHAEGAGKRVLLADDNADMRDYIERLLIGHGYRVETVGDGAAAIAALRREPPDLILSDVMMPRLDGFGLLDAVRGDQATASIPVILLSARAGEEAKIEGLDAGADDYLTKPFAARELLARVAANIELAQIRRNAARAVMRSEQKAILSEERLAVALRTGGIAVFEYEAGQEEATVLGPLAALFGVPEQDAAQGVPLARFIAGIVPDDRAEVAARIERSLATGAPYEVEYRVSGGGEVRRILARGSVQPTDEGKRRLVGALIDVSGEKAAQDALRAKSAALEIVNQAGAAVAANLDLEQIVQTVTDAGVALTAAEFGAFFYNVLDKEGESYMLYALSGAPRSVFDGFPMPRNTAVFAPTFGGEGVVRSDDITQDPRYGLNSPRRGMPDGHLPVRSYLAVPVRSRGGDVLGGLFFGHSRPAQFSPQSEEILEGLAAQAAVAIDNAHLFRATQAEIERRRQTEAELQALNASLGERVDHEVAERLRMEEALRQAQKMETIGQLTGGVAHDFNNLLTIIIGGLDTIRRSGPNDDARRARALEMATQGAQRAATLTSRLLAFARRQPLEPKPIDLNLVVRNSTELLHRTLGEQIELEGVLSPRLWPVEVDQNQLETAILNLAVNARDAMPEGGTLTIETANAMLDEAYAQTDREVRPGQYVVISISDNGTGMDKATLAKVFEPFFTTKEVGRGTGLGLSMVYGFAKQSGGHVGIYSEPGEGTTVKLYFPRYRGEIVRTDAAERAAAPLGYREEIVLVVEDSDDVREYSVMILSELGYTVLEAHDGPSALVILREDRRIDLLFTDVVLPGMTGRALADEALALRPELRILFTTGYSRNAIIHQGRLDAGVNLLTKPFTFDQLAERVRDVLDR
ncbi:ATP-binding protein [Sphingomonas sp. MMS24-J13]|uniref:ATP-binding protein n=1 Tax=Sphingomonas sp. MMS24-J13 TaxID=3238686 RepID=UPI00384AC06D